MTSRFADLGVPADLVERLDRNGISAPFDIQVATIPDALAGKDVLGRAPTGSGKTLAFGIPLIAALERAEPRRPRGLILSPTRELAEQIRRELAPLAQVRDRHILSIYGGVGFRDQLNGLKNGADLLVACPGRLIDLLEQGEVQLNQVDLVVVDEADRMADMGFLPQVREILDLTSPDRQTVLFSATLDHEVQVLIDQYQKDPVTHEVGEVEPDLSLVTHRFIKTAAQAKLALAADVIEDAGPTVVFCRTRHGVDRVARQLKQAGVKAGWIHGGRSQNQRDAALHAFTTGKVQALVATDVAARGIHVDGVQCVIHFDPPADHKDYVHRSGRTARAGAQGVVVSFVNRDQEKGAKKMMKAVGLPDIELEPTPELTDRADHVTIELRSKKGGKKQPGTRQTGGRRADDARPAKATPAVDAGERRSSGSNPPKRRGSNASTRIRAAAGGGDERADERWADGDDVRRAPSEPGRSQPNRSKQKSGKPGGKTRGGRKVRAGQDGGPKPKGKKAATKRSGKPRPKNKSTKRPTNKTGRVKRR